MCEEVIGEEGGGGGEKEKGKEKWADESQKKAKTA
jgi:hypothetical protein